MTEQSKPRIAHITIESGKLWNIYESEKEANEAVEDAKGLDDFNMVAVPFIEKSHADALEQMLEAERKDFCKLMNAADEKLNRYIEANAELSRKLAKCKERLWKEFKSNHVGFTDNHYQAADDDMRTFEAELNGDK